MADLASADSDFGGCGKARSRKEDVLISNK